MTSIVSHRTSDSVTSAGLTGGVIDPRRPLTLDVVSTSSDQAPTRNEGQDNHRTTHQDATSDSVDMPPRLDDHPEPVVSRP
jgi:hypothetical protein